MEAKTKKQSNFVDENILLMRGQRRMTRLVGADRKATVAQVTTLYNCGEKKNLSG